MSRQRKKMTSADRAKKQAKNARRGRTPAYLEAKRWADQKLKHGVKKPYSVPRQVSQKQAREIERINREVFG